MDLWLLCVYHSSEVAAVDVLEDVEEVGHEEGLVAQQAVLVGETVPRELELPEVGLGGHRRRRAHAPRCRRPPEHGVLLRQGEPPPAWLELYQERERRGVEGNHRVAAALCKILARTTNQDTWREHGDRVLNGGGEAKEDFVRGRQ